MLRRGIIIFGMVACLALAGCGAGASGTGSETVGSSGDAGTPTSSASAGQTPTTGASGGATGVTIFVEPQAGEAPVLQAIRSAQSSVWVEVYLLTDYNVIHALEDAAQRGVDTRVLLELNPYGAGTTTPRQTLQELQAAGVKAEGANPAFHYTHEKAMIVDGATLYIMTANLTKSGLGGSSYADNREYGVIDTAAADAHEASAIFQADWTRTTPTLSDPNLVVSPVNARQRLLAFIDGARTTLLVEDEEMYDTQSEQALIAAAKRGVNVEVVLPKPSGSASADTDVARLLQGGVHVRYITSVYMHAKMMVADGRLGFVGSENFSANSLDDNRELGILIADQSAVAILIQTFAGDWSSAQAA
ncbi:MAG TPA: phospholipase D-like domain-containing protein [Ktedonobacterales bacterium]